MKTLFSGSSEKFLTTEESGFIIKIPAMFLNYLLIQPNYNLECVKVGDLSYPVQSDGKVFINRKIENTTLTLVYKQSYLDSCNFQTWCEGYNNDSLIQAQEIIWDLKNGNYELTKKYKRYFVIVPRIEIDF